MNFLIFIENEEYLSRVLKIIEDINREEDNKIVFISLDQPYKSLEQTLFKTSAVKDQIMVIDAITKRIVPDIKNVGNCFYVSSPTAFDEILVTLDYISKMHHVSHLVFDSLSSLRIYSFDENAITFVNELINRGSKLLKCDNSFIAYASDKDTQLVKKTSISFDKLIELEAQH